MQDPDRKAGDAQPSIEQIIRETTEENQNKTDWTKAWSTVLKSGPANYAKKSADMDDLLDAICSDTCLWKSIAKFYGQKMDHCGHCDHCQRE